MQQDQLAQSMAALMPIGSGEMMTPQAQ